MWAALAQVQALLLGSARQARLRVAAALRLGAFA
jgi:hypothetical protein